MDSSVMQSTSVDSAKTGEKTPTETLSYTVQGTTDVLSTGNQPEATYNEMILHPRSSDIGSSVAKSSPSLQEVVREKNLIMVSQQSAQHLIGVAANIKSTNPKVNSSEDVSSRGRNSELSGNTASRAISGKQETGSAPREITTKETEKTKDNLIHPDHTGGPGKEILDCSEVTKYSSSKSEDKLDNLSLDILGWKTLMGHRDNVDISVFPVLQDPDTKRPRFNLPSTYDGGHGQTPSTHEDRHGQTPSTHEDRHGQTPSIHGGGHGLTLSTYHSRHSQTPSTNGSGNGQIPSTHDRGHDLTPSTYDIGHGEDTPQQVHQRSQTQNANKNEFVRQYNETTPTPQLNPERQEIRSPLPSTSYDEYVVFPDNGWPQGVDYQYDDSCSRNGPSRPPPYPTAGRWDYISKLADQQNKFDQVKKVAMINDQRYHSSKKPPVSTSPSRKTARLYRPLDGFYLSLESIEECSAEPPVQRTRSFASRVLRYVSIPLRKVQKLCMMCCCPDIDTTPIRRV